MGNIKAMAGLVTPSQGPEETRILELFQALPTPHISFYCLQPRGLSGQTLIWSELCKFGMFLRQTTIMLSTAG